MRAIIDTNVFIAGLNLLDDGLTALLPVFAQNMVLRLAEAVKGGGRRFSRQQGIEPSLPEVMVARQRITDSTILHDDERNTVGEAPMLVRPIGVECNPTIHQFRRGWNDFTGRART